MRLHKVKKLWPSRIDDGIIAFVLVESCHYALYITMYNTYSAYELGLGVRISLTLTLTLTYALYITIYNTTGPIN